MLLLVADGPRSDRPDDKEQCAALRALLEQNLDLEARILREYADPNVGLRKRASPGLTWAFTQVDRAIVLEDDCIASSSFFRYCSELLRHYEHDTRIATIGGNNFQIQPFACESSYYFFALPTLLGMGHLAPGLKSIR